MRFFIALVVLFPINVHASITEGGRGVLFGEKFSFSATAKSGWVLDNQSGIKQGLHMIFYPKEETWASSPVIIYGRSVPKTEVKTIKSQVEKTLIEFHSNGSPNYVSDAQPPLTLSNGNVAERYFFSGDQWGNYEAVVYFDEPDTINYLVFNARTKTDFNRHVEHFLTIASSYKNLYTPEGLRTDGKQQALKQESTSLLEKPGAQEYEKKAIQSVGQTIANTMRECSSYFLEKQRPSFSYFVRIGSNGDIDESYIFPSSSFTSCFSGVMATTKYPPHKYGSFLLTIEMNIQ